MEPLLSLLAALTLGATRADNAQADYERRRAELMERVRGGWRVAKPGADSVRVSIGGEFVGHWEFAQHYSEVTGEPISEPMRLKYDPPARRSNGLMIAGFATGGGVTLGGMYALMTLPSSIRAVCELQGSRRCDGAHDSMNAGAAAIGVGVTLLTLAWIYALNTESASDADNPYFTPDQLRRMVARYDERLRAELGLPAAPR